MSATPSVLQVISGFMHLMKRAQVKTTQKQDARQTQTFPRIAGTHEGPEQAAERERQKPAKIRQRDEVLDEIEHGHHHQGRQDKGQPGRLAREKPPEKDRRRR